MVWRAVVGRGILKAWKGNRNGALEFEVVSEVSER